MRELSMSELELVSGGYNTYDVGWTDPVTPPGGGGGDSGWGDWGWGDWGDYGDGGGGGGGGNNPGDSRDDYNPCEDRAADTIAEQLNNLLQQKPDKDRIEYGALIWRDADGTLKHSDLTGTENGRWTGMEGRTPQDFGMTSWGQVVGIFHHHPTEVQLENGTWVKTTPESHFDRPSSGDWNMVFHFIEENKASLDNLTLYLSYNGTVKEYDAYDNQTQSRNPDDRGPGHGIESGDYTPGINC